MYAKTMKKALHTVRSLTTKYRKLRNIESYEISKPTKYRNLRSCSRIMDSSSTDHPHVQARRYTYTSPDSKTTEFAIIKKKCGTGIKKLKHRPEQGTLFAGQIGGEFDTEVAVYAPALRNDRCLIWEMRIERHQKTQDDVCENDEKNSPHGQQTARISTSGILNKNTEECRMN